MFKKKQMAVFSLWYSTTEWRLVMIFIELPTNSWITRGEKVQQLVQCKQVSGMTAAYLNQFWTHGSFWHQYNLHNMDKLGGLNGTKYWKVVHQEAGKFAGCCKLQANKCQQYFFAKALQFCWTVKSKDPNIMKVRIPCLSMLMIDISVVLRK